MNFSHCPNCNATIKKGTFSSTEILDPLVIEMVNEFREDKKEAYCTKCPNDIFHKTRDLYLDAKEALNEQITAVVQLVPIVTINNPNGWDYEVIDLVTSQYVVGTGGFTELKASLSDTFGMRSSAYGKKLKEGENICKNELRQQAIAIGANAVVSAEVAFSEIGGDRGMLMVCMSGTAVNIKNIEHVLPAAKEIDQLTNLQQKMTRLKRYDSVSFI